MLQKKAKAMESRKIAIVGAGVSGLLACKHCIEKGFDPVVFESESGVGGIWSKTIESTRLQTPKSFYEFSDFAWPPSVKETFPDHNKVMDYLSSYASNFNILPNIKFNTKVLSIDYYSTTGPSHVEDFESWDLWGGSGEAFSPSGKWNLTVQNARDSSAPPEEYQVDFVILCIGTFSGLPNIPDFPVNKGPEVFNGVVMHSMEYAALDNEVAAEIVHGKRVTVVGSQKSALDVAAEVAKRNGPKHPCVLLFRTAHWMIPEYFVEFTFRGFNRFSEMMVHKPVEGFFQWLLVLLLSPLLWIFSKCVEIFLRLVYPLKKYNMVPSHGFAKHLFSCNTPVTPPNFFDQVKEGSLVLKKSKKFSFCKNGLLVDHDDKKEEASHLLTTDMIIFATGYKTDEKLKNIFSSVFFQKCIISSATPFYRECIHPRIPNLAMLGYASIATLYTIEMNCKWLAHFLAGHFKLPSIREMEGDALGWEKCRKRYSGLGYKRHCSITMLQIHTNDQICNDIGCNPRRKSWFLAELFAPYGPSDYQYL